MTISEKQGVNEPRYSVTPILRFVLLFSMVLLGSGRAFAASTTSGEETATAPTAKGEQSPQVEVMDIPTADILDPMTYSTTFRFYNEGGLMSRLVIGPLKRVNLGISFDAQRVTGSGDPHLIRPSAYFKLRFFDGTDVLPALALGFDNQGFLYQESTKEFLHREKGLYLVGSHEILIPNLELHAGVNMFDFDHNAAVFGFFGATLKITPNFALLSEYDNIRNGPENRVNIGGRYWIAPYFNVDFGARNIGRGTSRGAERILRLNYVGHFPGIETSKMADEIIGLEFEKPILELETKIQELKSCSASEHLDFTEELKVLEEKCSQLKTQIYGGLSPWQRVMIARHSQRPYTLDYIRALCSNFIELHGDRSFSEDAAIVGGLAIFEHIPVVVIGHQKGRTVQESMFRNFGMPHPEGYRKALRLMKLAEKFHRPVLCFIDTPGAYPGIGAEERGQARAIALNLFEMASLKVPMICTIIGEGGSGGALAIGMGDRILMCENAWYSVISPEGCAAILFRDAVRASEAAAALKLTAPELKAMGIIDEVIPEPLGGGHRDIPTLMEATRAILLNHLKALQAMGTDLLLETRYQKFRSLGVWREAELEKVEKAGRRRTAKLKSA